MPDAPDVAVLRAENGRLRVLLEDKDARIAELEGRISRLERWIVALETLNCLARRATGVPDS